MTGVQTWSVTAANNVNANTGVNWDEGMPPGAVNNSARQVLADLRAMANDLVWFQYGKGDGPVSHSYASATSTTVPGVDVRDAYHAGRRVKAVGSATGTIFGTISSSTFSTNTTVNYAWDSGSLSNEALTIYLSQVPVAGAPVGPDSVSHVEATLASGSTTDLGSLPNACIAVSGTTTITSLGAATNLVRIVRFIGALTLTYNATSLILPGAANIATTAGDTGLFVSDSSGNWRCVTYQRANGQALIVVSPALPTLPTRVVLTTGSSYSPQPGARLLHIRMVGGGGGGGTGDGGSGGSSGTSANGGNGGDTVFNGVHAAGGHGGQGGRSGGNIYGGVGGSGGTGTAFFRSQGGGGGPGIGASTSYGQMGGEGGSSGLGGGQPAGYDQQGLSVDAVGYGGGGGGGEMGMAGTYAGAGGGAGEYVELNISSPASSYTYSLGSSGNGGVQSGNFRGGNGGTGVIVVDEYY